jgi:hypothetical protein
MTFAPVAPTIHVPPTQIAADTDSVGDRTLHAVRPPRYGS